MRFIPTTLPGAFIVELELREDERGFFARTFCAREFSDHGLAPHFAQCSTSFTRCRGTVRGLHYQVPPVAETKLVRCTAGALLDVIVDLREASPTYRQHLAVELTAGNRRALYVPEMFAHGFQTLADDVEVVYQISEFYTQEKSFGVRFDDPALAIAWPLPVADVSERDRNWPLLSQIGPMGGRP